MSTVLARMKTWHRPLMVMVTAMTLLVVVSAVGTVVDDRALLNESIWVKPLKFGAAFVIYGATLAWMLPKLRKAKRTMWAMGTLFAITGVIDVGFIAAQAARGTYSHFNTNLDTFNQVGQKFFATGVIGLFGASLVIAIMLLFQRVGDAAMTWAIRTGVGIAAIGMGLGYMIVGSQVTGEARTVPDAQGNPVSMMGQHGIGAPDGSGMPLTNWSIDGGDMRVPHFFGMHAIQLLLITVALLSFLAARVVWLRSERVRAQLVLTLAAGYGGFVTLLTWQALRGQSLVYPDSITLTALGALAAAWALAMTVIIVAARRSARRPVAAAPAVSRQRVLVES